MLSIFENASQLQILNINIAADSDGNDAIVIYSQLGYIFSYSENNTIICIFTERRMSERF